MVLRKGRLITSKSRSELMSRVRQSGTSLELRVREALKCHGLRFSTRTTTLPGSPDIANRAARWAIFVNGCFWHAHSRCRRWKLPLNNRSYWRNKFKENKARDQRVIRELHKLGYRVLTIWGCDVLDERRMDFKLRRFVAKS